MRSLFRFLFKIQSLRRPIQPHTILRTIRRADRSRRWRRRSRRPPIAPASAEFRPLPWAQAWTRISSRREHQGLIITDGQSAARQQILNSLFDRRTELSAGCLEPQHSAHNRHHLFATRAVILVNDAERGEPKL